MMILSCRPNAFSSLGTLPHALQSNVVERLAKLIGCRKENITPPVGFADYKSWLASHSTTSQHEPDATPGLSQFPPETSTESNVPGNEASAPSEPAYPSSFAHIVELITTGQPIPGIQEIPDTVLEGHDLASEKPRRRKPWEKDDVSPEVDKTTTGVV